MSELSRREFAKLIGAAGIASSLLQQPQTASRTIGIQVGAVSFVDEDVESVLDRFQRDANINALFIASFSYGRGIENYKETSLGELPRSGLSADYVDRETRRAVAGVNGKVRILSGVDIDIPTGRDEKKTESQDVREAVRAALRAGADGVILSRKYSEMRLANLRAVGEALRL